MYKDYVLCIKFRWKMFTKTSIQKKSYLVSAVAKKIQSSTIKKVTLL